MKWPNRNAAWADLFVQELARSGMREACLAPGSRSAPLVIALARHPEIRTFVHLDERCAAFFALGLGKATGRPAVVLTTSGTAAANLFPAVIEAEQGEVPLLVLTADRPHRLRGQDANQTIDQLKLYGPYVRLFHDVALPHLEAAWLRYLRALPARALAATLGPPPGPVHLNFPFEKPLEPSEVPGDVPAALVPPEEGSGRGERHEERSFTAVAVARRSPGEVVLTELADLAHGASRGLLVCGPSPDADRLGPAAIALAKATGFPLLADPLSGARFAPGATEVTISAYDLILRHGAARAALAPDLVIRCGSAGSSSSLGEFLRELEDAVQVVVDGGGRWKDHASMANRYVLADPAETLERLARRVCHGADAAGGRQTGGRQTRGSPKRERQAWRAAWREAEQAARQSADTELEREFFEGTAAAEVASLLPPGATLFIGNSMPVRDLESFAAPRDEPLRVLGNRGTSGIDGTVSTAFGTAAASGGPVVALLGDLALYHDMNGLLAARRFGVDLCVIVLHNDGGGIFHLLPIRTFEPPFTSHFATPHGLDFRHAARLYDLPYERVAGRAGLRAAVGEAVRQGGSRIVEVPSDPVENRRRHEEVADAVRVAVAEALALP